MNTAAIVLVLGILADYCMYFADVLASKQVTVKFVQDTSKFWYKPDISRDQGRLLFFVPR